MVRHESVLPPPVSVSMAWRLLARSQVASGVKVSATLLVVQVVEVPLLSLSRYLCTSKMMLSVVPSGLVTLSRSGPASVGRVWAEEYCRRC